MTYTLQFDVSGVSTDLTVIHDGESFLVQWKAQNLGPDDTADFVDHLVVAEVPEGCPGSDDGDHPVVWDSDTDGDPDDFAEAPIPNGGFGPVMEQGIGPLTVGSYRLTVTLDQGGPGEVTIFTCIDVVEAN